MAKNKNFKKPKKTNEKQSKIQQDMPVTEHGDMKSKYGSSINENSI